jgi:hypothetical protein
MLTAGGTIGTRANPLLVDFNLGNLAVAASGTDGTGVSVNINGTVLPRFELDRVGTYPGQVIFNGRVLTGPELNTFQASAGLVGLGGSSELLTQPGSPGGRFIGGPPAPGDVGTLSADDFVPDSGFINLAAPYLRDDFIEEDLIPETTTRARPPTRPGLGVERITRPKLVKLKKKLTPAEEEREKKRRRARLKERQVERRRTAIGID